MTYVRHGVVYETRPVLDPRRVPEALFAVADGVYFFFVTIISYDAASSWLAGQKKKNDDVGTSHVCARNLEMADVSAARYRSICLTMRGSVAVNVCAMQGKGVEVGVGAQVEVGVGVGAGVVVEEEGGLEATCALWVRLRELSIINRQAVAAVDAAEPFSAPGRIQARDMRTAPLSVPQRQHRLRP